MNAFAQLDWIVAMGLLLSTQAQAEVIYTEEFDDVVPVDRAGLANVNWSGHVNVPANPYKYARDDSNSTSSVFQYNGSAGSYGYASLTNYDEVIAWTTEPSSVSTLLLESISFKVKNDLAGDVMRIAIRIGSDWFATDEAYGGTGSFTLREFEWTTAAAAWRDLTFEPGTALSVASSARTSDLPSGSVDAFGLFIDPNATGAVRFDDFTISATAVPEPSTLTLLLGLGGLFALVAAFRR